MRVCHLFRITTAHLVEKFDVMRGAVQSSSFNAKAGQIRDNGESEDYRIVQRQYLTLACDYYLKDNNKIASIWRQNKLRYLSLDIICSALGKLLAAWNK